MKLEMKTPTLEEVKAVNVDRGFTIGEIIAEAGYALAPIEPTDAMIRAGFIEPGDSARAITERYKAMLKEAENDDG